MIRVQSTCAMVGMSDRHHYSAPTGFCGKPAGEGRGVVPDDQPYSCLTMRNDAFREADLIIIPARARITRSAMPCRPRFRAAGKIALGAKAAKPNAQVICLHGDVSFGQNAWSSTLRCGANCRCSA